MKRGHRPRGTPSCTTRRDGQPALHGHRHRGCQYYDIRGIVVGSSWFSVAPSPIQIWVKSKGCESPTRSPRVVFWVNNESVGEFGERERLERTAVVAPTLTLLFTHPHCSGPR